jgi:FkbM family methyltransferase
MRYGQLWLGKCKALYPRLWRGRYFSLNNLDRKLEQFVDYDNGYFVELGANDGMTQSNSLYFEIYRNWRGLLVEPAPANYLKCKKTRSSDNAIFCAACVSFAYAEKFVRMAWSNLMSVPLDLDSDIDCPSGHAALGAQFLGRNEEVFEFDAVARTLQSLLIEAGSPHEIDFLSLDVEGTEFEVLKGIDHEVFRFKFMLIECRDFSRIQNYLGKQGYRFVDKLAEHDYLFADKRNIQRGRNGS